jgi:hypothetical protein
MAAFFYEAPSSVVSVPAIAVQRFIKHRIWQSFQGFLLGAKSNLCHSEYFGRLSINSAGL